MVNTTSLLYNWIDKKAELKFYVFYLSFFLVITSLIIDTPYFIHYNPNSPEWKTILLKANDLTNSLTTISPYSHIAKRVFRLTVPILIRLTNIKPPYVILLQYFLGYLLIVYAYKLSLNLLKDKVSSTFLVAGLVFLYFGRAGFYDLHYMWFDGIAFFFLIVSMYSQNVFAIFLFATISAWTDERAFVALFIVFIFHQISYKPGHEVCKVSLIRFNKKSVAILISITFYIALRFFLSIQYNMHTPYEGANLSIFYKTRFFMSIGIWTFLEGFWLIVLLFFAYSIKNRDYVFLFVISLALIGFTIIAGCVTDITRSGSYLIPVIFVLIVYLRHCIMKKEIRLVLLTCFIISLLFPATIICADWSSVDWFQYPDVTEFMSQIKRIMLSIYFRIHQ